MNITTNELMLLNRKNLKLREMTTPQELTTNETEAPVQETENKMDALNAQAMNNITFQKLNLNAIKKAGLGSVLALSLMAGLSSCDDETKYIPSKEPITVITNVSVDMSAWTTLFQQMLQNQQISQEQYNQMISLMKMIHEEIKNGNAQSADFYKQVVEYMMSDTTIQQKILDQEMKNGKTAEEAQKTLQEIKDLMAQKKYEQALDKIYNILGDINAGVQGIYAEVKALREDLAKYNQAYLVAREEELEALRNLYIQGEYAEEQRNTMLKYLPIMNDNLEKVRINTDSLLKIAKDDSKWKELMAKLDTLKPEDIDYAKFEEMFKLMNMNLQDLVKMSKEDVIAAIEKFKATYIDTEAKQIEQLTEINNKLDILEDFPNLDQTGLKEAIEALGDKTEFNGAQLTQILAELIELHGTVKHLYIEVGNMSSELSTRHDIYVGYWKTTLDKLNALGADLNAFGSNFEALGSNFKALINAQKEANKYLAALDVTGNSILVKMDELAKAGKDGMTVDEFKAAMKERDEEAFKNFEKMMIDLGYAQLPADVKTIKDLLGKVNDKLAGMKDYSDKLDKIIAKLESIDWTTAENKALLEKIKDAIENHKCEHNCNHAGGGTHEGILDDLGGILG